jgi:hypothetical protein
MPRTFRIIHSKCRAEGCERKTYSYLRSPQICASEDCPLDTAYASFNVLVENPAKISRMIEIGYTEIDPATGKAMLRPKKAIVWPERSPTPPMPTAFDNVSAEGRVWNLFPKTRVTLSYDEDEPLPPSSKDLL